MTRELKKVKQLLLGFNEEFAVINPGMRFDRPQSCDHFMAKIGQKKMFFFKF